MRQLMKNPGKSFQPPVQCKERACAKGASAPTSDTGSRPFYIISKLWIFEKLLKNCMCNITIVAHYTTPHHYYSSQQQQTTRARGHSIASCLIGFWMGGWYY